MFGRADVFVEIAANLFSNTYATEMIALCAERGHVDEGPRCTKE